MIIGDRLRRAIAARGTTQGALARAIGVSPQAISKMVLGSKTDTSKLHQIAKYLETTPEYLTGETDDPGPGRLSEQQLPYRSAEIERSDTVDLAEFNLAYGLGASFIHDSPAKARQQTFSRTWLRNFTDSPFEALFFAKGIGDSMMPTILDNDIVLIDTAQRTPRIWDQLWAIDMGGLGMIKRLRPGKDGAMRLLSDNAVIPEEIAYDGEMNVIGRVVAIVRKT